MRSAQGHYRPNSVSLLSQRHFTMFGVFYALGNSAQVTSLLTSQRNLAHKTLGAFVMKMHRSFKFLSAALMLTAAPWIITASVAAPISPSLGLQNAVPTSIETVQYGYGWNGSYRRWDRRANRWDRRAYRRGYGYDGYNAYAYAPAYTYTYPAPYYSYYGLDCSAESLGRSGC